MGMFSKIGLGIYYRLRRMKKALKNWRRFGVIIFGSLMLTAMSGVGSGITSDQVLTATQVQPTGVILVQGATEQFAAASLDQYGQPILSGVTYSWQVVTSAAGSITNSGLFTAGLTSGLYTNAIKLTAIKGASTKFAYATVTVQGGGSGGGEEQLVLTTVAVSPTSTILAQGATKQFNAYAYDQKGNALSGVTFSWTTTTGGSISNSGLFTAGLTSGQYTNAVKLTATKGTSTKFAYATVTIQGGDEQQDVLTTVVVSPTGTILAKGATKQFTATAYDQHGTSMTGVSFNWQVVNSAAGAISQSGLFTAGLTSGLYNNTVKVTGSKDSSTKYAYATVTVQQGEQPDVLTTVVISPTGVILAKGATKQFTATAYNQNGAVMSGVPFTWNVVSATAGSISTSGLFTAGLTSGLYNNTVKVTGTKNGVSKYAYATVTVQGGPANQPPVARIMANPTSGVTSLVATLNASASTDSDGTIVNYKWDRDGNGSFEYDSGSNPVTTYTYGVGTWTPRVQVTDNDGATDTAAVTTSIVVSPQPPVEKYLAYVVVIPPITVLDMHATQQFTATSYDQNNQIIGSGVTYNWDLVSGGGGDINHTNGYFTAGDWAGTFDHTVRARAIYNGNTRYGYATVIVNPIHTQAVLERVEILPPSVTISRNASYDFAAYAYDTNNAQMFSGVTYTWSVISGPGYVDQNGVYTATNSDNTATIQVEARQGNIQVYDTALIYISTGNCTGILDHVVITPQTGYVHTGNSIDFDAQAYDTTGCLVSVDLYFSLDGNVPGSINNSGYFTANYTTGTYNDGVRVRAYKDGHEVYDWATVVITSGDNQNYYIDASLRAYDETIGSDYRANEGDTVLYTLKLTNNRNNSVTGVTVTMEVPDYTNFSSVTSQSGTPSIYGRTITWNVGSLYSGESKTMWLRVRVKDGLASNTTIRGKAFVKAYEISSGFWVYANELPVNGTGPAPIEPLTPTGAMEWILAVMTALLATILTRQLMRTRKLLLQR